MDLKEVYPANDKLLPRLLAEQKRKGFVSEKTFKKISDELKLPISRVYAAATFYSQLFTKEQGKYVIEICNSPSCYLNKSIDVIKLIQKELKIKSGQTTKDKKFSLHICSCIGCCNQAPAMMINKKVYGNLTKEKAKKIIEELRKK
jgi:NADH-quinone oxidoreductase subunit E